MTVPTRFPTGTSLLLLACILPSLADEPKKGREPKKAKDHVTHLILFESDEACPEAEALAECRRLTAEKYLEQGYKVTVTSQAKLKEWLEKEGTRFGAALADVQLIRFAQVHDAHAIGGVSYWEPDPRWEFQKDDEPQFYGWLFNLRTCSVNKDISLQHGTEIRAIPLTSDRFVDFLLKLKRKDNQWTIPSKIDRALPPFAHNISRIGSDGKRPLLGIAMKDARLSNVIPDSPAEKAGMLAGDELVSIDGHAVGSMAEVVEALKGKEPGNSIEAVWKHDEQEKTATLTLEDYDVFIQSRKAQLFGKVLPDLKKEDFAGKLIQLSDFRGKVILLNFWATWCGPCKAELPMLVLLDERFRDRDFVWVNVSVDEDAKVWRKFVENNDLQGVQVRAPDWANELSIRSYPTTYLVDEKGVLRTEVSRDDMTMTTAGMIAENRASKKAKPKQVSQTGKNEDEALAFSVDDVAGEYYFGDGLGVNCRLNLKKDGQFSFTWSGCMGKYDENAGPWSIEDGLVVLKPTQPNVRKGFRGTATRLYPIRWSKRLYLVSDDEMIDFCSSTTLSWAVGSDDFRGGRSGSFYLRKGDEKIPLTGMPTVPPLYEAYLKKPFSSSVLKVNEDGSFLIDRGKQHGLVVGTKLRIESGDQFGYEVKDLDSENATCIARSPRADPKLVNKGKGVRPFMGN